MPPPPTFLNHMTITIDPDCFKQLVYLAVFTMALAAIMFIYWNKN